MKNKFKEFCKVAKLNNFKSNPIFCGEMGNPMVHVAIKMLFHAKKNPLISANIDKMLAMDSIGLPQLYTTAGVKHSLNVCRYINSIEILNNEFGNDIDNWNVLEIGCGFGGLAHCVLTQYPECKYYIEDFEEVERLCVDHSNALGHSVSIEKPSHIDLCICEYSVTEMSQGERQWMDDEYLMQADHLFIRCNLEATQREVWLNKLRSRFTITVSEELEASSINKIVIGRLK